MKRFILTSFLCVFTFLFYMGNVLALEDNGNAISGDNVSVILIEVFCFCIGIFMIIISFKKTDDD